MLGFSPMVSETFFTAADHIELIQYVLNVFNKSLTNVVVIIGDDAEVNKSRANLCGIPLIGCASHKFQLAVSYTIFLVTRYILHYTLLFW